MTALSVSGVEIHLTLNFVHLSLNSQAQPSHPVSGVKMRTFNDLKSNVAVLGYGSHGNA
jgi:hypothetical protein